VPSFLIARLAAAPTPASVNRLGRPVIIVNQAGPCGKKKLLYGDFKKRSVEFQEVLRSNMHARRRKKKMYI